MIQVFKQLLDSKTILGIQKAQYSEKLFMSGSVPAQEEQTFSVNVSNLGDFLCKSITGTFETLDGSPIVDDGVCHLRGQLVDGAQQTILFNDFMPLDLLLSPGRVKSALSTGVATDPVGGQYLNPLEFEYLFRVNGSIQMKVKNDATTANRFSIAFHGIRIINTAIIKG